MKYSTKHVKKNKLSSRNVFVTRYLCFRAQYNSYSFASTQQKVTTTQSCIACRARGRAPARVHWSSGARPVPPATRRSGVRATHSNTPPLRRIPPASPTEQWAQCTMSHSRCSCVHCSVQYTEYSTVGAASDIVSCVPEWEVRRRSACAPSRRRRPTQEAAPMQLAIGPTRNRSVHCRGTVEATEPDAATADT